MWIDNLGTNPYINLKKNRHGVKLTPKGLRTQIKKLKIGLPIDPAIWQLNLFLI